MAWVFLVVTAVAAALGGALQASVRGGDVMWAIMLLTYLLLAVPAFILLRKQGLLSALLTPRSGDLTIGVLLAAVGVGTCWGVVRWILPPASERSAWVYQLLEVVRGFPEAKLALWLLPCVALEELVWRGWVQSLLRHRYGERLGWILAALCYALAHVPSLFALRVPSVGLNPLLVMAALGMGLVLGFTRERCGRLLPGLFSHATFTYFSLTWLWPG